MDSIDDIIRVEENGIEYFTIVSTGESGFSHSGLSRITGIPRRTLSRWLNDLGQNNPPEHLKSLQGKCLHLGQSVVKRGSKFNAITADVAFEIIEYAAFERGDKTARQVLKACGLIGLTSYIQGKTGWLPSQHQSSKEERELIDFLVLHSPEKRDIHFDSTWRKEAERVTQYNWDSLPMAKFIRRSVYEFLPAPMVTRLCEVNPYFDGKRRNNKHYQHLEFKFDETILRQHIRDVYGVLCTSASLPKFWQNMRSRFNSQIQGELEF